MEDVIKSKIVSVQRTSYGQNAELGYFYDLSVDVDALAKKLTSLTCMVGKIQDPNAEVTIYDNIGFMKFEEAQYHINLQDADIDNIDIHATELKRFVTEAKAGIND